MCKHLVLMRDVIIAHHPEFKKSSLRDYALKNPTIFNVERLIEESLAAIGGYNFIDETGRDFDDADNSDSKTTTVNEKSLYFEIGSVENKIGSLRIVIYNPLNDSVDFMYLPNMYAKSMSRACFGKCEHKLRLVGKWNEYYDHYNQFERFRLKTFKDLAKASG